jgi:hypothetical protein
MQPAVVSRRLFLAGGISLSGAATPPKNEAVYDFGTVECEVRMSVAFYDRYFSSGFWFRDLLAGRRFCLSAIGGQDRDCSASFAGSLAVACYRFLPHSGLRGTATLRERVRTIDQDTRLNDRPPLDRIIELREGVASDIQAFGYEMDPPASSASARLPESGGPWYYFRQDLYFAGRATPFLTVHWRHAFGAIRILDVIPGDGTSPVKRGA